MDCTRVSGRRTGSTGKGIGWQDQMRRGGGETTKETKSFLVVCGGGSGGGITDYWALMETAICRKRSKTVAQETASCVWRAEGVENFYKV